MMSTDYLVFIFFDGSIRVLSGFRLAVPFRKAVAYRASEEKANVFRELNTTLSFGGTSHQH